MLELNIRANDPVAHFVMVPSFCAMHLEHGFEFKKSFAANWLQRVHCLLCYIEIVCIDIKY